MTMPILKRSALVNTPTYIHFKLPLYNGLVIFRMKYHSHSISSLMSLIVLIGKLLNL